MAAKKRVARAWAPRSGDPVFFAPVMRAGEPEYAGVVDGDPFEVGGEYVVDLRDMEHAYGERFAGRTAVRAACFDALRPRTPLAGVR